MTLADVLGQECLSQATAADEREGIIVRLANENSELRAAAKELAAAVKRGEAAEAKLEKGEKELFVERQDMLVEVERLQRLVEWQRLEIIREGGMRGRAEKECSRLKTELSTALFLQRQLGDRAERAEKEMDRVRGELRRLVKLAGIACGFASDVEDAIVAFSGTQTHKDF